MEDDATIVRIVKLRRTLALANRRFTRRHQRALKIFLKYKQDFGRQPWPSSHVKLLDLWDWRNRHWQYGRAVELEEEAALLVTRLHNLLSQAQLRAQLLKPA